MERCTVDNLIMVCGMATDCFAIRTQVLKVMMANGNMVKDMVVDSYKVIGFLLQFSHVQAKPPGPVIQVGPLQGTFNTPVFFEKLLFCFVWGAES